MLFVEQGDNEEVYDSTGSQSSQISGAVVRSALTVCPSRAQGIYNRMMTSSI